LIITSEAVVLNSRKYGDTSKIVSCFTKEQGKVSFIAKGARSKNNKFGSLLEPLNCIIASYYFKPGRDLQLITGADLLLSVRQLHSDIEKLAYGLSVLESISQALAPLEQNTGVFDLLINFIEAISNNKAHHFSLFVKSQIQLAELLGFAFDFNHFLASNGETKMFSLENGSIIDDRSYKNNNILYLEEEILDKFIKLSNNDMEGIYDIMFDKKDEPIVVNFFIKYFGFHLESKFFYKSMNLVNIF